jgi:copper chaperone CopZ
VRDGLTAAAAIVLAVAATDGAATMSAEQQQTAQSTVIKISGMACHLCSARVERTAPKIDGVHTIKASQPEGQATVSYDPAKTTPEAIAKKIEELTAFRSRVAAAKRK